MDAGAKASKNNIEDIKKDIQYYLSMLERN